MAFDYTSDSVVLFGGATAAGVQNDTWRFDGVTWNQLSPAHAPPARENHAVGRNYTRVMLFGGRDGGGVVLDDTWVYQFGDWVPWLSTVPPSARELTSLAYSNGSGTTLLFGGRDGSTVFADTWLFTGDWIQRLPAVSPPARFGHGIAFLQAGAYEWVLFGGRDAAGNYLGDTWTYHHGTNVWTPRPSSNAPPARAGHTMEFDHRRQRVTMFGGSDANGLLADTWDWDGASWLPRATGTSPPARTGGRMVDRLQFGAPDGNMVLFGGETANGPTGATWELVTLHPAQVQTFGFGCGLQATTFHLPQIGHDFWITQFHFTTPLLPHFLAGFSNQTSPLGPLPLTINPTGNPCELLVDPQFVIPPTQVAGGSSSLRLSLPNWPGLLGTDLFVQGFEFDLQGQNSLLMTAGLQLTIGGR